MPEIAGREKGHNGDAQCVHRMCTALVYVLFSDGIRGLEYAGDLLAQRFVKIVTKNELPDVLNV